MSTAINIRDLGRVSGAAAAIGIELYGVIEGKPLSIVFGEDDSSDSLIDKRPTDPRFFGKITGTVRLNKSGGALQPQFTLENPIVDFSEKTKVILKVAFAIPGKTTNAMVDLFLPDGAIDVNEGDYFEIVAAAKPDPVNDPDLIVKSPPTLVSRIRRALPVTGSNPAATYSFHQGNSVRFFRNESAPDGSTGYFADLVAQVKQAKDFIFIADWSFHAFMRPLRSGSYTIKDTFGALLIQQAIDHPDMVIAIHAWDHTNLAAKDEQNDDGKEMLDLISKEAFRLDKRPKNVLWRKSSRTGIGNSHHQKFVVMDSPFVLDDKSIPGRLRPLVFMGGMDITKGRFDSPDHPFLPGDPATSEYANTLTFERNGKFHQFDDWYNAEFYDLGVVTKLNQPEFPRQTWHDIGAAFLGPSAWDIVREFVGRWLVDPAAAEVAIIPVPFIGILPVPGNILPASLLGFVPTPFSAGGDHNQAAIDLVLNKFKSMFTQKQASPNPPVNKAVPLVYAQQWDTAGGPWSIQICRSLKREHWEQNPPIRISTIDHTKDEFKWNIAANFENSIQLSYSQAISQAEHFVYIETQYFISSGFLWGRPGVANRIAFNLANRAIAQFKANKPFHIYIAIPLFPEGKPGDGSNGAQRKFQWASIRAMARKIESETGQPYTNFLSVYFLAKWTNLGQLPDVSGTREENVKRNKRYQIYIHAKFMIIDDRFLFLGSANLNERSLAGDRDSEIGAAFWPSNDAFAKDCIAQGSAFRKLIWQGHLGPGFPAALADNPGSAACAKAVQKAAAENYKAFREGRFDTSKHGQLCMWPLNPSGDTAFSNASNAPEHDTHLPDRPDKLSTADDIRFKVDSPDTSGLFISPQLNICE